MKKAIAIMCLAAVLISYADLDTQKIKIMLDENRRYVEENVHFNSNQPSIIDCTDLAETLEPMLIDFFGPTAASGKSSGESQMPKAYQDIPLGKKLQDDVQDACDEFGVPEDLLYAVMEQESGYQLDAVNGPCVGLMQIHKINYPTLVEEIGIASLENPTDNIRSGAYILGGYLKKYDVADALMAYNLGESGAKKLWREGTHETKYTKKVLDRMKRT